MRKWVFLAATVIAFAAPNWAILGKERLLKEGRTVLVALGPVDPRSLMQGDYMRLGYAVPPPVRRAIREGPINGLVVITTDENGVAAMDRVYVSGSALAEGESLLVYRRRLGGVSFGARSFFFQEGQARLYAGARYGELAVAENGDSVLVGLRDAQLRRLGPEADPDKRR